MNGKERAKKEIGLRAQTLAGQIEAYCSFLEKQPLDQDAKSLIGNLQMTRDYLLHATMVTLGCGSSSQQSETPLLTQLKEKNRELASRRNFFRGERT